jgi:arylsulfatase A-like enzyme
MPADQDKTSVDTRPNLILIVADDLGYSDINPFGGNINTPQLDRLSKSAMTFSNFHVLPTCSPTRSALLSGNDNHVAGLGVMGEFIYPAIKDLPGYEGHLNNQVASMPEVLREAGYHTFMAGKWHLGEDDEQSPHSRGFEETFTLMNGGGSHWTDMKPLSPPQELIYRNHGEKITTLPDDFYSTKNYTDSMIAFIDRNKQDGKPFLAYLSFTAPHDPLHAPVEYIERYKGKFDAGWAQASSSPFRFFKSFTSEGGIKSPMIIKTPGEMENKGHWNHSFLHVTDILPTILELAEAKYPEEVNGHPVKPPIGKSIIPILNGKQDDIHDGDGMGYELFEMKAYIKGDWKILRFSVPFGSGDWELYNIKEDPGEIHDLSDQYHDKKAELLEAWDQYVEKKQVFDHNGVFDAAFQKAYGTGE